MVTLTPIGARVVVIQIEAEVKSEGGIVIPDTTAQKSRPSVGKILAIGDGCASVLGFAACEKGTKVVYNQFAGSDVEVQRGVWHKILNVEDVLAVYEE